MLYSPQHNDVYKINALPDAHPTNSVKALKEQAHITIYLM